MTEQEVKRAALDKKAAYYREWRAKNKDKVKASNEKYWRNRVLKSLEKEGEHGTGTNADD